MLKIALIGNQNSGKTSLFNFLTGNNQKIGNWPGVTVDISEGFDYKRNFEIFDLPGIYSFSPYSLEEKIARDFVLKENIDLIVNVIDSVAIERSLYLTTQLLELDIDVIVVLNMFDIVKKRNIKIDINEIEKKLGVTIVPISIVSNYGIDKLVDIINKKMYLKRNNSSLILNQIYPKNVLECINYISEQIQDDKHRFFKAIKFFEKDLDFNFHIQDENNKIVNYRRDFLKKYNQDEEELVATFRYNFITNEIINKFVEIPITKSNLSNKIDYFVLNRFFAIPFFLLMMGSTFYISTVLVKRIIGNFIESFFIYISNLIEQKFISLGVSNILTSFLLKGVISGTSVIAMLIPQIVVFFFCLLLIESTGYISRIAFSFDFVFRKLGLSGKSVIPFVVGMECTVPGIMNTRAIENDKDRKKAIILLPFVICNTKLAVIVFLVSSVSFFKEISFFLILLFYLESIFFILLLCFIFKKIFFIEHEKIYIDELPTYKMVNFKYVFRELIKKILTFVKKIGTTILFFSVILWFFISFDLHLNFVSNINDSILAKIGNLFAWFFYFMLGGKTNWAAGVISLYGLVDKEQIISSIKIIGFEKLAFLNDPLSSFAFLTFNLFSIPCFCTLTAMLTELKSVKKVIFIMIFELLFAWFFASLIGVWGLIL